MSAYRGPTPKDLAAERAEVEAFPALLRRASLVTAAKRLVLCATLALVLLVWIVTGLCLDMEVGYGASYPAFLLFWVVGFVAFRRLARGLGAETVVELLAPRRPRAEGEPDFWAPRRR